MLESDIKWILLVDQIIAYGFNAYKLSSNIKPTNHIIVISSISKSKYRNPSIYVVLYLHCFLRPNLLSQIKNFSLYCIFLHLYHH